MLKNQNDGQIQSKIMQNRVEIRAKREKSARIPIKNA